MPSAKRGAKHRNDGNEDPNLSGKDTAESFGKSSASSNMKDHDSKEKRDSKGDENGKKGEADDDEESDEDKDSDNENDSDDENDNDNDEEDDKEPDDEDDEDGQDDEDDEDGDDDEDDEDGDDDEDDDDERDDGGEESQGEKDSDDGDDSDGSAASDDGGDDDLSGEDDSHPKSTAEISHKGSSHSNSSSPGSPRTDASRTPMTSPRDSDNEYPSITPDSSGTLSKILESQRDLTVRFEAETRARKAERKKLWEMLDVLNHNIKCLLEADEIGQDDMAYVKGNLKWVVECLGPVRRVRKAKKEI